MLMRWVAGITWLPAIGVLALIGTVQAQACVGDCDEDGQVGVNELITGVNMALGLVTGSACAAFLPDAEAPQPTVADLISGVNNALNGCPVTASTAGIVFNAEANRLHAYRAAPGFPRQTVIPSDNDAPGEGRDINGQICFTRGSRGELRFISGEDTGQGAAHLTAGWGLFELEGEFPTFTWRQLNEFIPTYQPADDEAENYGCGFLSDGRLVTTDVGNQAGGAGTGQLIMWFPPLDGVNGARYCKLDIGIATAQQIAVDEQDRIYVASARTTGASPGGVTRYSGPFPTSDFAADGCGRIDPTGAPLVSEGRITKELFIRADGNITNPGGIVLIPGGGFYIASVLNGVIAEYDSAGVFKRRVLSPPRPGLPTATGNPLGLGLASDGTLYFADIGLQLRSGGGIGPGRNLGKVRRIRFVEGQPQPPEIMDESLNFPDGIGILELPVPTPTPISDPERTRLPTATRRPS